MQDRSPNSSSMIYNKPICLFLNFTIKKMMQDWRSPDGETLYQAVAGKLTSLGKTAGQALDALTAQLDNAESPTLLVLQSFQPDKFFNATQQTQLIELMPQWRNALKMVNVCNLDI